MSDIPLRCALAFSLFLAVSGAARSDDSEVLILVDKPVPNSANPSSGHVVANLMGHFGLEYEMRSVAAYEPGAVDRHYATFYVNTALGPPLPIAFLDDILTTNSRVIWVNLNLNGVEKTVRDRLQERLGIRYLGRANPTTYEAVTFDGQTFPRYPDSFAHISIHDQDRAETLATFDDDGQTLPYIVNSDNFYLTVGNVLAQYAEDSPYLVFCELLHEILGIPHSHRHRALVRIEDIDAMEDPDRLRAIADYLHSEAVPFSLAVIPRFYDPLGAWGPSTTLDLADRPKLVAALKYAESKRGTIVLHGYTHQYDAKKNPANGVTGIDSEFYLQRIDPEGRITHVGPVPEDSESWVRQRLDAAAAVLGEAGFHKPDVWVTPHYLASDLDYRVFTAEFEALYQRLTDVYFPYYIHKTVYGGPLIPENLGYISPGTLSSKTIIERAKKHLVVRDGIASFFFHSEVDLEELKAAIAGIKTQGYKFVAADSVLRDDNPD